MIDSTQWDEELAGRVLPAPLLQSWAWGEVQARAGWAVDRVRLPGGAMASVQIRKVGPARAAYVPRGPVPAVPEALDALGNWARQEKMARLVVEPETTAPLADSLRERGFAALAQT